MLLHLSVSGRLTPIIKINVHDISFDDRSGKFVIGGAAVLVRVLSNANPIDTTFSGESCKLLFQSIADATEFSSQLRMACSEVHRLNSTTMD